MKIQEIQQGVRRIELEMPLFSPRVPLKLKYNVYAVKTHAGMYLFDCGSQYNVSELKTALEGENIKSVFLTHGHVDHAGGGKYWLEDGVEIFASKAEYDILRGGGPGGVARAFKYPGFEPAVFADGVNNISLDGEFNFTILPVPGHTSGSICYYEAQKNLLISGDLLYGPLWGYAATFLAQFLTSLRQPGLELRRQAECLINLADINVLAGVTLVLPGHGPAYRVQEKPKAVQRSARLLRLCRIF